MTYERHTYTVENPSAIKTIMLADADVSVEVLSSENDSMYAVYYASDKENYDIEVDGDTLYIKKNVRFMVGLFLLRNRPDDVKLTLGLPVGFDGDLNIATADGNITVYGVTMHGAAIKTVDGNIAVSRSHIKESLSCKTIDGDISAGNITALETTLKTTDGDITLDRPLISSRLSCRTTDGDIDALLAGRASDYAMVVKTTDGRSNIASGGAGKTVCEVRTADGDINVSFEDR